VNLFSQEDPTVENGRFCYKLFMDEKKASFPTGSHIEAIVYSAYDNTPVMGAIVKAGLSLSTDASTGVTNGQGVAYVPIFSNGVYDMVINGDGFENNYAVVDIDCTGSSSCTPRVQATLSPNLEYGQAMISLNWGTEVEDMDLKLFYVNAYSSDEYTMADENNQDAIANAYYVQNSMEYSEISGLSKANSIQLTDLNTQDGVSYMVAVYNSDIDEMSVSESIVTYSDGNYTKKIGINNKFEFEYSLRGVLLFGEWSSVSDIFNADEDEQRNSLIVQLSTWSSSSITDLQALTDDELINYGAVTAFMKVLSKQFSTQSMLAELTFQEQMDAFLYELAVSDDVLNWFRASQGDWYLTSGDLEDYFEQSNSSKFDIVFQMAQKFSRTPEAKHNWISGCISVFEDNIVWVPVGEFVNTIDPFFCHNLVFSDFVATAAPEPEFYDNVGLEIIVRNSQNNEAVTGAYVSVTIDDGSGLAIVADDTAVSSDGSAFIPVHKNGFYSVQIEAEGFVTSDFEMEVQCTSADCPNKRLVAMSPTLAAGETRIMLTWGTENPRDIDIHIVSVKKSDHSTCRTYYGNKSGCQKISQDLDNTSGGQNGAETMTLLDNAINKDYVYLIGIEDYNFEDNGTPFLSSGATISVTNGVKTVYDSMVASSISYSTEYYFFGCVKVTSDGDFTFLPAPEGTFFNGNSESNWVNMMSEYC